MINEAEKMNSKSHRRFDKFSDSRDYHHKRQHNSNERSGFKKPKADDSYSFSSSKRDSSGPKKWQKPEIREKLLKEKYESIEASKKILSSNHEINSDNEILTEEEMNKLGAKIVKAEIMGNNVSLLIYLFIYK